MKNYQILFSRKSTPMVFLYSAVKIPLQYFCIMEDFPTAPLPTMTTWKRNVGWDLGLIPVNYSEQLIDTSEDWVLRQIPRQIYNHLMWERSLEWVVKCDVDTSFHFNCNPICLFIFSSSSNTLIQQQLRVRYMNQKIATLETPNMRS